MLVKDIPKIMTTCLFLTIIIETFFALLFQVKDKKDYVNIVLVNMITNPLVVMIPFFLGFKLGLLYQNISLIFLEILTVIIEGLLYKKYLSYQKINPLLLSLFLNLLSYFVGEIYWRLV